MKTALLFGATGLVGGHCLKQLLEHPAYSRVVAYGRRSLSIRHARLEQKIIDFDRLENLGALPGDDLFYCMGTTLKKAGSRAAFRRVDLEFAEAISRAARAGGVKRWLMVSAIGASARSWVFYSRIKGQAEDAVVASGISQIEIFRPSFLLGERSGADRRVLEELGIPVFKAAAALMVGPLKPYRPIEATEVARRMIEAAQLEAPGVHVRELG